MSGLRDNGALRDLKALAAPHFLICVLIICRHSCHFHAIYLHFPYLYSNRAQPRAHAWPHVKALGVIRPFLVDCDA
ncbi:MAG: hypothetical protein ACYCWB_01875 [Thiobacillus sp.]